MDFSIEDDEKTLTMIDPMYGEESVDEEQPEEEPLSSGSTSLDILTEQHPSQQVADRSCNLKVEALSPQLNTAEDNTDAIRTSLKEAFSSCTSSRDIQDLCCYSQKYG